MKPEDLRFKLDDLSPVEVNTIANGLGKLPYEQASPVIDKIRSQVQRQEAEFLPQVQNQEEPSLQETGADLSSD